MGVLCRMGVLWGKSGRRVALRVEEGGGVEGEIY